MATFPSLATGLLDYWFADATHLHATARKRLQKNEGQMR